MCQCDCEKKTKLIIDTNRLTSGLKTHCGCRRQYRKRIEIELPIEFEDKLKQCSKCNNEKKYKEFYFKEYINAEGIKAYMFNPQCISCDKEDAYNWGINNPEKKRESCLKDGAKPERRKQYRENGKRQRENGYTKQYIIDHPEKAKQYAENHRNHDISTKEWNQCLKVFNHQCAYCDISQEEVKNKDGQNLHKEHVNNEGYNDLRNGVPACRGCNDSKWAFEMIEWFKQQPFFSEEKLQKILWWCNEGV